MLLNFCKNIKYINLIDTDFCTTFEILIIDGTVLKCILVYDDFPLKVSLPFFPFPHISIKKKVQEFKQFIRFYRRRHTYIDKKKKHETNDDVIQ